MPSEHDIDAGTDEPDARPSRSKVRGVSAGPVAAVLDALSDAAFVTDLAGVVLGLNRAAVDLLHVAATEAIGRPLLFFVAKQGSGTVRRALKAARIGDVTRAELRMRPRRSRPSVDVEMTARPDGAICVWVVRKRRASGAG
jgi:PAS domain-containing protein